MAGGGFSAMYAAPFLLCTCEYLHVPSSRKSEATAFPAGSTDLVGIRSSHLGELRLHLHFYPSVAFSMLQWQCAQR